MGGLPQHGLTAAISKQQKLFNTSKELFYPSALTGFFVILVISLPVFQYWTCADSLKESVNTDWVGVKLSLDSSSVITGVFSSRFNFNFNSGRSSSKVLYVFSLHCSCLWACPSPTRVLPPWRPSPTAALSSTPNSTLRRAARTQTSSRENLHLERWEEEGTSVETHSQFSLFCSTCDF